MESPCDHEERDLGVLFARIRQKDETALSNLYDRTAKKVFSIAKAILGDDDLAGEATIDVYTKIWRHPESYDPSAGSLQAWLRTLSRNRALDHLRKRQRRARIEEMGDISSTPPEPANPESDLFRREQADRLQQAMQVLNPDQASVMVAAYFEGMSHGQIAAALNKPLGTVKTQIRQAMDILRRTLASSRGELL